MDNAEKQPSAHDISFHRNACRSHKLACRRCHTRMSQSSFPPCRPHLASCSPFSCPFQSTESASLPCHSSTSHPLGPRSSRKAHHDSFSRTHAPHTPKALHASFRSSSRAHNPYPRTSSAPLHSHKNSSSSAPFYHTAYTAPHDRSGHKDVGSFCFYRKSVRKNVVGVRVQI